MSLGSNGQKHPTAREKQSLKLHERQVALSKHEPSSPSHFNRVMSLTLLHLEIYGSFLHTYTNTFKYKYQIQKNHMGT